MIEYELFYLVGEKKEPELARIRETVEKLITSQGGSFLAPETSEKRKLAYEVKDEIRGIYVARRFTLPDRDEREESGADLSENVLDKIKRELELSTDILRSLLVRADDLPKLEAIERVEKVPTANRGGSRYERRGAIRPMPQAPVAPKEPVKPVSDEKIDEQLKDVLNI